MQKSKFFWITGAVLSFAVVLLMFNVFVGIRKTSEAMSDTDLKNDKGIVVIDAGHGGFDPGCVFSGTEEKWINLEIAIYLRDIFSAHGYTVVMTRTDDTTMADDNSSSRKRTDTHNRAELVDSFSDAVMISIHQNSFTRDKSQHGTQLFYGMKNEESKLLAECIMASVVADLQPDNVRPLKQGTSSIYILKTVSSPIALVECGFMTNSAELAELKDSEYCRKVAYCIFLGYEDYLNARER